MSNSSYIPEPGIQKLTIIETMNVIQRSTFRFIDTLNDGERILMEDLCDKVSADTNIRNGSIAAFVPAFVYSYPDAFVKKGRGGGVVKGKPKVRVDSRPRCPTCHQIDRNANARAAENENEHIESMHQVEFIDNIIEQIDETAISSINEFEVEPIDLSNLQLPVEKEPEVIATPASITENDISNIISGNTEENE